MNRKKLFNRCNDIVLVLTLLTLVAVFFIDCTGKSASKIAASNSSATIPQHIVSLSPASTEILFAVGAESQISAVSQFSDYPPEASKLPLVGGFDGKTLSVEKILSFKPDFVYMTDGMHNFLIDQLNQYGIKFYLSTANSVEGVKKEILEIGSITGHEKKAKALISQIEKTIASCKKTSAKKTASAKGKAVYYEVWNAPYMTAGKASFINDIITIAGGNNIFSDVDSPYPIISEEAIIMRQPEIIFIPATSGITEAAVASRIGWEKLPAVKNDKIFIIDDNLITRPGPRIGESVKTLYNFINQ